MSSNEAISTTRSAWGFTTEPEGWREQALCAEVDPELFFPGPGASLRLIRLAKQICSDCPVQRECLDYALKHNETFGVWGGTSYEDRKKLKRGQEIPTVQPCGTVAAYQRHVRDGQTPCEPCRQAKNASLRKWWNDNRRKPLPELDWVVCDRGGSAAQAKAHRRRGQKPCAACLKAEARETTARAQKGCAS